MKFVLASDGYTERHHIEGVAERLKAPKSSISASENDGKLADWLVSNPQEVKRNDGSIEQVYVAEFNSMDEFETFVRSFGLWIFLTSPGSSASDIPMVSMDLAPHMKKKWYENVIIKN